MEPRRRETCFALVQMHGRACPPQHGGAWPSGMCAVTGEVAGRGEVTAAGMRGVVAVGMSGVMAAGEVVVAGMCGVAAIGTREGVRSWLPQLPRRAGARPSGRP